MSETKAITRVERELLPSSICYAIFVLSGFAGLVYEATWVRYLKGILGHEAYAQMLVLGIFLGGLAVGAALAGKYLPRMRHPLICYAIVEAVLALMAVAFHDVFVAVRGVLEAGLGSTESVRWLVAALLILPQSVLLGTTFPLLAAAVVRGRKGVGKVVAWLYFSNSMGGVIGVLAVGTVLVELGGLPGSMLFAALASAVAGLVAWVMHHRFDCPSEQFVEPAKERESAGVSVAVLSLVAAGTGLASLIYEIVWVRMLALVLGSSTRSFEIMLAAFIFGLALGSYFVQRYVDRQDRLLFLAKVQLLMGTLAIAGIFYYQYLFHALPILRAALPDSDAGYAAYGVVSFFLSLLLMIGPALCAGMTLPLLTRSAMATRGERALGAIYAWNTLGSIAGIALAALLLLPLLGLKLALLVGAFVDLALGVLLLRFAQPSRFAWGMGAAAAILVVALVFPPYNRYLLSSGPYRVAIAEDWRELDDNVLFYQDGSTLSAAVHELTDENGQKSASLISNGRSEGYEAYDPEIRTSDALVSELFTSLGLLYHPDARRAAVIGYGVGLSSSTLLRSDNLEEVVTLEIEQAIVDAGEHFPAAAKKRVREDPRSHIVVTDAKTYFAGQRGQPFDIIVSIPSHPWVSGVASLFSKEHFAAMHNALADDGVLVQWIHVYEFGPEPLATIIEAINESFPSYYVYIAGGNLAVVTSPDPSRIQQLKPKAWQELPEVIAGLKALSLHTPNDVASLAVAGKEVLQPYFASYRMPANSDYFPVLDIEAARAFYLGTDYDIERTVLELRSIFSSTAFVDQASRQPFAAVSSSNIVPVQYKISIALSLIDESVPLAQSLFALVPQRSDLAGSPMEVLLADVPCEVDDEKLLERLVALVWLMRDFHFQLYPAEFALLWKRLNEELPCFTTLREAKLSKDIYAFYDAVAASDHDKVLEIGKLLLPNIQVVGVAQLQILLRMMVAGLQLDKPEVTLELSYSVPAHASVEYRHAVRLLGSHALARLEK